MGEGLPAAGHVVAYDSPIYIADAALYLKAHRPDLKIKDVYELDEEQFQAAIDLLKQQRPMVNQYWANYLDELQSFKSGYNYTGTAWQVTANLALADKAPVATTLPSEGATGWSDTWMVSSKAQHPTCMYKWMNWITTPKVQAEVAQWFGEAPANPKACRYTAKGFCSTYHVGDPEFYKRLAFWKTPVWRTAATTAEAPASTTPAGPRPGPRSRAEPPAARLEQAPMPPSYRGMGDYGRQLEFGYFSSRTRTTRYWRRPAPPTARAST